MRVANTGEVEMGGIETELGVVKLGGGILEGWFSENIFAIFSALLRAAGRRRFLIQF